MRTQILTRQTIHEGTEALAIVQSPVAYYVIHINDRQQCEALPAGQYWSYDAAHDRLQQEFQAQRQVCGK